MVDATIEISGAFGPMRRTAEKLAQRQGFRFTERDSDVLGAQSASRDALEAQMRSLVTDLRSFGINVVAHTVGGAA